MTAGGWSGRLAGMLETGVLLAGLTLTGETSAAETPQGRGGAARVPATETKTFKSESGVKVRAEIGKLAVPEYRGDPASRAIDLAFVRLKSEAARPAAPLVYLAGGPGESATWMAEDEETLEQWLPALSVGDVILLDQRGTGSSTPSLRWRWEGPPPIDAFTGRKAALDHALEVGRRARAALTGQDIDPRGYTTVESVEDIDDLRRALGLEKISLFGFSYGTHLGLAYIRYHGDRVENAVLTGIEGPDHTWKLPLVMDVQLRKLSRLVAGDPVVGAQVPDMMGLIERVLRKLEAEPMVVSVDGPKGGRPLDVPVGPFGLMMILRFDVGDASDLPVFPRLLYSIDQGDPRILRWFVQKRAGMVMGTNGMSTLMDCASGASEQRINLIREQGARSHSGEVVNFPFPDICGAWETPELGAEFREPLVSDVRTLFLSGTLDFNTPPHQAEEVRWGFSRATHLVVENAGHEQVLPHPEIRGAWVRFLKGEDVSAVHATWPPLRFVPLDGYDPEATHPSVPRP